MMPPIETKKTNNREQQKIEKLEKQYPGLLISKPHITLICGTKGSGKSHLTCKLLLTAWKGIYDEIIFVSPTFKSQLKILWSKLDPEGIECHEDLTDEFVLSFLNQQQVSTRRTLLILDDVGDQQRRLKGDAWNKLVSNSRHYDLSIICLHQKLTQSDTITRQNADTIICFPSASYQERECLYRERSSVDRKSFMQMFCSCTQKPYTFMCCTIKKSQLKFYMSDFKTEIHPSLKDKQQ